MDFTDIINKRYSVRSFSDKPVEKEKIDRILEAGRLSPTGVNWQPQRILVFDNEGIEKFKKCTYFVFGATAGLLVCYDAKVSWTSDWGQNIGPIDASFVLTTMMYAAENEGLGTIVIGGYNEERLRELFKIPDFLTPAGALLFGYPTEDSKPHPVYHQRKPLEETVFYGDYSQVKPGDDHTGKHRVKFPD